MRTAEFDAAQLQVLLERRTVCTFEQLADALGTGSRMTVFRKLAQLPYLTSYSHRGKYYALRSTCRFDAGGLWSHRGIWFSADGTLLDTSERFVERAPAGYSAVELDNALHVQTRQALLELLRRQRIDRERIAGTFVYLAVEPGRRQRQLSSRGQIARVAVGGVSEEVLAHEVKAAIILFFGLLDERQRRLFAGLEALKLGRGGDARVAAVLGLDPHTVAKGRIELLGGDIDPQRIRKAGGGRRAAEKNSAISRRIEQILADEVAGDPIAGTRWTRKTTGSIAEELLTVGIKVSAKTVGRLLRKMQFSLKTNRKNIESGFRRKPGDRARRNRQFQAVNAKRRCFETADLPIISVDGKKRELIGNFKNAGRTWRREPTEVNDHDFLTDAEGVALPYGIYDLRRNAGTVVLGTSRETPAFAVDAIEYWWRSCGQKHYPGASELLILADAGGANSPRCRVFKCDLQQKLCNRHGLRVIVCHYPPGASKWNPIEHRLFSQISKNWQGVPLRTYEVALNYLSSTRTASGLTVAAKLHSKLYQKGEEVTEEEMGRLNIRRHETLPEWNYTISPYNRDPSLSDVKKSPRVAKGLLLQPTSVA